MAKISIDFRVSFDFYPHTEHIQHSRNLLLPNPLFFRNNSFGLFNAVSEINLCYRGISTAGKRRNCTQKVLNERLTAEQVEELKSIVTRKTDSEKLYLDPSLTLSVLSGKIGISTHELSYVLNNGLGKSFYQFINELRTEEAKSLLLSEDTKHLDMLGVAIRAGFNSKTTFYTTFKKATKLTPKEYIKANSKTS